VGERAHQRYCFALGIGFRSSAWETVMFTTKLAVNDGSNGV
jgi:hypothetical protein